MLYVSAGMDKAGTTYAYNLLKLLLEAAGHSYIHLPRDVRGDPSAKERGANNIWSWTPDVVQNLGRADVAGKIVALRTHAEPSSETVSLLRSTGGKCHSIIRDPRDLALSMMDVARRLTSMGKADLAKKKDVTKEIAVGDLISTFSFLRKNIEQISRWADIDGCLVLYYEDNAFRPEISMRKLCRQLELNVPEAQFHALAEQAADNPNTKRNVALPNRHTREMPKDIQERFLSEFRPFYDRFFPAAAAHTS